MDGSTGSAVDKVLEFYDVLVTLTTCPIDLVDERLTTVSGARNLRDSGVKAKESKSRIDEAAAVAILEFGLSIEKNRK
jgi:putative Holliday junction resolvase